MDAPARAGVTRSVDDRQSRRFERRVQLAHVRVPRRFSIADDAHGGEIGTGEGAIVDDLLDRRAEVDDLPPPVNADYSFASYHSKTEVSGNMLKYTRTFEVKELSVPVSKVEDLKKLYRIIAGDERNTAVLKPASH